MFALNAASAAVGRVRRRMHGFVVADQNGILCVTAFAVDTEFPVGTCIAALAAVLNVGCQIDNNAVAFGGLFYAQIVFDIITI